MCVSVCTSLPLSSLSPLSLSLCQCFLVVEIKCPHMLVFQLLQLRPPLIPQLLYQTHWLGVDSLARVENPLEDLGVVANNLLHKYAETREQN